MEATRHDDTDRHQGLVMTDPCDWLTYQEAATMLGLSLRTLKRRVYDGHIRPIHPPGGHPRITRREVEAYRAAAETRKRVA